MAFLLVLNFVLTMYLHNVWMLSVAILVMLMLSVTINDQRIYESNSFYKGLVSMGNWTFSYFLVHLYILRAIEVIGGTSFTLMAVAFDLIGIIIAWGVSYLSYTLIEQRFTNILKGLLLKK